MKTKIQITNQSKVSGIVRVLVALPVLLFGIQHLFVPAAAMKPLVEAAGLPFPGLTAMLAPIIEILGALILLPGIFARIGAALLTAAMAGATATHLLIAKKGVPWPNGEENNPGTFLPAILLLGALFVLWKGAGTWSLDYKMSEKARVGR